MGDVRDQFQIYPPSIDDPLSGMGEVDGDPVPDTRLDLSGPPFGCPGVTDDHARFQNFIHLVSLLSA